MARPIVLTEVLTVGQITFVLRAVIQIIGFLGIFLLTRIIVSTSPRVASFSTHDVVNRIVGKETSARSSLRWMFYHLSGRNPDPTAATRLLFAISLFTVFSLFISLSDVGFLGLDSCRVPGGPIFDKPLSVNNETMALSAVRAMLVNGTDPRNVRASCCHSSELGKVDTRAVYQCTRWQNSSYADSELFRGINSTDSDMLLPRSIRNLTNPEANFYRNSFYVGTGTARIAKSTLSNGGVVVEPHSTGVRAVFGVPPIPKERKAFLEKTLAQETQMGCIELGMSSYQNLDDSFYATHQFDLRWTSNRRYSGPERFQSVLTKYAEKIRDHYRPKYIEDIGNDMLTYEQMSSVSEIAEIRASDTLGERGNSTTMLYLQGNCTIDLMTELGIPKHERLRHQVDMCDVFTLSGSLNIEGEVYAGKNAFLCASASQVNMVSASVEVTQENKVVLDVTSLPSDLRVTQVDCWDILQYKNDSFYGDAQVFTTYSPSLRYTLTDNPSGPTEHYIRPTSCSSFRVSGIGSGGLALAATSNCVFEVWMQQRSRVLALLDEGRDAIRFPPEKVTTWGGQVAASQILESTALNAWVAKDYTPIRLVSTGGKPAVCYRLPFAAAFIPLLVVGFVSVVWGFLVLFPNASESKRMEELYGGIRPLRSTVCPQSEEKDALFEWQTYPEPHLQILWKGQPIIKIGSRDTAVDLLRTVPVSK